MFESREANGVTVEFETYSKPVDGESARQSRYSDGESSVKNQWGMEVSGKKEKRDDNPLMVKHHSRNQSSAQRHSQIE